MVLVEQGRAADAARPPRRRGRAQAGTWGAVVGKLFRDPTSVIAMGVIAILAFTAIFAPLIVDVVGLSPIDADREHGLDPYGVPVSPSLQFWLGVLPREVVRA